MTRALVFALAVFAIGCTDSDPMDGGEVATFEETKFSEEGDDELVVRAVFLRPALGGDAAWVHHEEIPDRMPAMEMQVALERPDLIAGLASGDKVTLTYRTYETGIGFVVTAIQPLPEDTVLDLVGSGADSAFVPPGL